MSTLLEIEPEKFIAPDLVRDVTIEWVRLRERYRIKVSMIDGAVIRTRDVDLVVSERRNGLGRVSVELREDSSQNDLARIVDLIEAHLEPLTIVRVES